MEHQRRRVAPRASPDYWRQRAFARQGIPLDRQPAPFNEAKARKIPDFRREDGARGRLDIDRGPDLALRSGDRGGPIMARFREAHGGRAPSELGFAPFNSHHVEAQAAAYMRLTGRKTATLYINKVPCTTPPDGCDRRLPQMLPADATLTVYAPEGVRKVYRGLADPPGHPDQEKL